MRLPCRVRVLGACGLASAGLMALAGPTHRPDYLTAAGVLMVLANLYALLVKETP